MTDQTLMVLAASMYQVPVIRTAKRLGFRVITTDNSPGNPGHALSDRSYGVDTTDRLGVLGIARKEGISGIIAACTDVAVPTAAYVSEALGLPGISFSAAQVLCSKINFRQFQREHGLPAPAFELLDRDQEQTPDLMRRTCIIKPDCSSGSKGIFIVRTPSEFVNCRLQSLEYSPWGRGIVERYIEGHQGTCEGFLWEGKIRAIFFLDRRTVMPPHTTTCGHRLPSRLPRMVQGEVLEQISTVFGALSIDEGPFDADFVASGNDVYLIEVTPRIGGNSIADLLKAASGFDILEMAVRQSCGIAPSFSNGRRCQPAGLALFGAERSGRLSYNQSHLVALRNKPWVYRLEMDHPIGTRVEPFVNGRHRLGDVIVTGRDLDEVEKRIDAVCERLDIRTVSRD